MGLFNSTVLDWAIGIVFVYLLLAIICTAINEWVAGFTQVRSKTLEKAIAQLLDGQPKGDTTNSFLKQFYAHPLITGMMKPGKPGSDGHPAYLQARTFATTVMDLVTAGKSGSITFAELETGVKSLPLGDVRTALLALLQNAEGRLSVAQKNIEQWFDDTMERASGWYKNRTQIVTIVIAAILTIGTNADTVRIGHLLWTNPTLRAVIVEDAKGRNNNPAQAGKISQPSQDELDRLNMLVGWSTENLGDWSAWPSRLLGWFLTATAISLGAPFWFDLLNRFMNLRNAGKKPEDPPTNQPGDRPSAPAGPSPPVLPVAEVVVKR